LSTDIAGADPDAHLDATIVVRLAIGAVDRTLDLVRGVHRLRGCAERRDHAVPEALHHGPAVLGDRGGQDLVVTTPEEIGGGVYRIVAVPAPAATTPTRLRGRTTA
jgi:hypothetical protein